MPSKSASGTTRSFCPALCVMCVVLNAFCLTPEGPDNKYRVHANSAHCAASDDDPTACQLFICLADLRSDLARVVCVCVRLAPAGERDAAYS